MIHWPTRSLCVLAVIAAAAVPPHAGAAEDPAEPKPPAKLPGPTGTDVAFSRDGKRLLTAGGDQARVWDAQTYKPVTPPLRHEDGQKLYLAALSPDGKLVLTVADNEAWVWDAAKGRRLSVLRHEEKVRSASFSPDGTKVLTAGDDRTARVWNAAAGKPLFDLPHQRPVLFAAFSPDGQRLFTLEHDPKKSFGPGEREKTSGHLWDARTGTLVSDINVDPDTEQTRGPAAFSADGKKLVTAGWGYAGLWDAATGQRLRWLRPIELSEHPTYAISVALNADGTRAVTTYFPGRVQAWDTESGQRIGPEFGEAAASYTFVAFASGKNRVLLAGHYDTSGVWDLETGRPIVTVESWDPADFQNPPAVAVSPDGKHLAAGFAADGFTSIWQVPERSRP